jgi:uncharacterized membrane-anchored protein
MPPTTYAGLVEEVVGFINILIPALFGIVFVYFTWKMIDAWILNAGDEVKRTEGRKYLIASVVAFVVMISAWGLIQTLRVALFG